MSLSFIKNTPGKPGGVEFGLFFGDDAGEAGYENMLQTAVLCGCNDDVLLIISYQSALEAEAVDCNARDVCIFQMMKVLLPHRGSVRPYFIRYIVGLDVGNYCNVIGTKYFFRSLAILRCAQGEVGTVELCKLSFQLEAVKGNCGYILIPQVREVLFPQSLCFHIYILHM